MHDIPPCWAKGSSCTGTLLQKGWVKPWLWDLLTQGWGGKTRRCGGPSSGDEFWLRGSPFFPCPLGLTPGTAINPTQWEINILQIAGELLALAYFLSIWLWWRRTCPQLAAQLALLYLAPLHLPLRPLSASPLHFCQCVCVCVCVCVPLSSLLSFLFIYI